MARYELRRLAISLPILAAISFAVFWAANKIAKPGTDLVLNPRITSADRAAYLDSLGLDDPLGVRYLQWLGDFATGDLGTSLVRNGAAVPVMCRIRGHPRVRVLRCASRQRAAIPPLRRVCVLR